MKNINELIKSKPKWLKGIETGKAVCSQFVNLTIDIDLITSNELMEIMAIADTPFNKKDIRIIIDKTSE